MRKNSMKQCLEADTARSLMNRIHGRQATFLGHVIGWEKLEHLVLQQEWQKENTAEVDSEKRYWMHLQRDGM